MNFNKLPFDMFATKNKDAKSEEDGSDETVKQFADEPLLQTENHIDSESSITGESSGEDIQQNVRAEHEGEFSGTEPVEITPSEHENTDSDFSRVSLDEIKSQLEQLTRSINNVEPEQHESVRDEHTEDPEVYRIPRGLLHELKSFVRDISRIDESKEKDDESKTVPDVHDREADSVTDIMPEMQKIMPDDGESEGEAATPEILSDEPECSATELPAFMPEGQYCPVEQQAPVRDEPAQESAGMDQPVSVPAEAEDESVVTDPAEKNGYLPEISTDLPDEDGAALSEHVTVDEFSEPVRTKLQSHLETFADNHRRIRCLLISTTDGFEIASFQSFPHDFHIRKLSALTSSLSGISSAMLREVGPGEQDVVFIESSTNIILFKRLTVNSKEICLMAVTTKDESVGQLFWYIRLLSADVTDILNNSQ